jgi:glycosyltransferase involved in cell wall biosynthesis
LVALSVGRISGEKNDELLLRGFAEVLKSHPNACLVVVGRCRDRRRLSRMLDQLGIGANVRMPGVLQRDELADYYAVASVVVICSETETQSLVAQEAQGVGCPVVVVDPWLAQGHETSRVLAEPNPAALAAAIGRSLSRRGPGSGGEYRPSARGHGQRLLEMYQQLTGARVERSRR